jgi:hypothetical protein
MQTLLKVLGYLWAFPATALGLTVVALSLVSGGKTQVVEGVLEVHGGFATWLLSRGLPWVGPGAAMTLGHVVLGCDLECLERTRRHEHVHVRQYERWGPLMIPLYLLYSLLAYRRGQHPYLDNPFEKEAFETS